jgi:hypothetical protein
MPFIQEQNNLGDVLKYEAPNLYSREEITVAQGQNLALGSVVAKDTATNLIKVINPVATDGTQTAIGIVIDRVEASSSDIKAVIIARDALLADNSVVWPEGITEEQKLLAIQQLEATGIIIRKGV